MFEATEERCGRRTSDLRGRSPTDHALRAGEVAQAAKRDDAAPGPIDAQPPAHSDVERAAVPPVRDRGRGAERAEWWSTGPLSIFRRAAAYRAATP